MATVQTPSDRRRYSVDVTGNKTLTVADCGIVQNVIADGKTITLPATAFGLSFTIRNGGVPKTSGPTGSGDNGSVLITIAPQAADKIQGGIMGASADNTAMLNTKATARVGDEVTLVAETNGYSVVSQIGTWASA